MNSHVCPWWLAYSFDNPVRRLLHDPARLLGPYVFPGATAVDVGCGLGYFSLGLARLVGPAGRVISVDLQAEMLARMGRRAEKAGLNERIQRRQCRADDLGVADLAGQADFVLAFWMVHETPDIRSFLTQIRQMLKADGRFLLTEPKGHISDSQFQAELGEAKDVGLQIVDRPRVSLSRTALLKP